MAVICWRSHQTEITSGDVIRILEGPIQPIEGLEDTDIPQHELMETNCRCGTRSIGYNNDRRFS